jgi:hypothetical protein
MGLFAVCSLVGWFAFVAVPITAHVPPDNNVNFNPDEWQGVGTGSVKEGEQPSDAEDGFGTAYELRAVADSQTAFYEWYDCFDDANPGTVASACAPIATDSTPEDAKTPPGEGTASAFTGSYNIPSTSDHTTRDWWGIACQADASPGGPPYDVSHCIPNDVQAPNADGDCPAGVVGPPLMCVADLHPDDAQTTTDHPANTNGHIHHLVTASRTFTHPDVHGAGLRNGETLTVIAFTSAGGVDAVHICMDQGSDDETPNNASPDGEGGRCTHNGTDTTPTPGGGAACHAAAPVAPGGDCWAATIGVPNANTVFGMSLIEYDDGADAEGATFGTGDCTGSFRKNGLLDDCQLDKVYVTTTAAGDTGPPMPPPTHGVPPPPDPCPGGLDTIRGTRGRDRMKGDGGCNRLRALAGNDRLRGRGGNDVLIGGTGNDVLNGGGGIDVCSGNAGRDRFTGCETIKKR